MGHTQGHCLRTSPATSSVSVVAVVVTVVAVVVAVCGVVPTMHGAPLYPQRRPAEGTEGRCQIKFTILRIKCMMFTHSKTGVAGHTYTSRRIRVPVGSVATSTPWSASAVVVLGGSSTALARAQSFICGDAVVTVDVGV